ncbi:MAG: GGDEF domain-containing protein [Clostridia bacterium]|nr:GGDEF domain-containing protein [Clostridia bacterium]
MGSKGRKVIAVCASWEDVENLNLVLDHLIRATEGTDYLPMCIAFDRSSIESRGEESLREFLSVFEVPNLAGFLLFGEMIRSDNINAHLIRLAHGKGLPVFMLERQYEGCINLSLSYREGFEQMARHIVEYHGCRDVVMVAGIKGNAYSEERVGLCRDMLEAHGSALPPEQVIYGDFWDEPTTRALDGYFAAGGAMPEAFICANDAMAIAVCIYLAQRNIRVPAQVRVAGFDGILQGGDHEPSITTMRPDYLKMFRSMLDRIGAWRPEETGNTEILPVPFELIRGESCGCEQASSVETVKKVGRLKMLNLTYTRHIRGMGNFIRKTLSMNSLEKLAECIPPLFSMWHEQYCFSAALDREDPGLARPMLHGVHGTFVSGGAFRWKGALVPDFEALLCDPSVRIVLAQLLQNEEETLGYLVSGMDRWNLWEQERFEEQVLFLSSALNAVTGNYRLEQANAAMLKMAEHDYLTGHYNRRGFLRELEHRLRLPETQGLTLTLFAMDMDGLKGINDVYGHHEGDRAISCLAQAIQEETEGRGICARYGGDEFAFAWLAEASFLEALEEIRTRIEASARRLCESKAYRISASIGACASPVQGLTSLGQLLGESDRALYADKLQRKRLRAGGSGE